VTTEYTVEIFQQRCGYHHTNRHRHSRSGPNTIQCRSYPYKSSHNKCIDSNATLMMYCFRVTVHIKTIA